MTATADIVAEMRAPLDEDGIRAEMGRIDSLLTDDERAQLFCCRLGMSKSRGDARDWLIYVQAKIRERAKQEQPQ